MTIFADAIDELFADPNLARDAVWHAGGSGTGMPVRVIARHPDHISDFGDTRIVTPAHMFDIRVSKTPTIAEGDTLEVEGTLYVIQGKPRRDAERLVWSCPAREQ